MSAVRYRLCAIRYPQTAKEFAVEPEQLALATRLQIADSG